MDPFQAYKDKTGMRIAGILKEALSNGAIKEDQSDEVATYILDNIDLAKTNSELLIFVENLSAKWPIFNSILTSSDQVQVSPPAVSQVQEKTDQAVHAAEDLLRENKIEEALGVAKTATEDPSQNPPHAGIGGVI